MDNLFLRDLGDGGMIGDGRGDAISVSQGQSITLAHNVMIGNSGVLTTDLEPEKASSVIMLSGMMDTSARPNYVGLLDVIVDSNQILNSGQGLPAAAGLPNNFAISVQATDRFTITNNLIAGTTLGGIVAVFEFYGDAIAGYVDTHGEIVNNTIYDNGTYGIWLLNRWHPGLMRVTNNIIMGHKYGVEGIDLFGKANPVPLDYSVLYGNEQNIGPEATAVGDRSPRPTRSPRTRSSLRRSVATSGCCPTRRPSTPANRSGCRRRRRSTSTADLAVWAAGRRGRMNGRGRGIRSTSTCRR